MPRRRSYDEMDEYKQWEHDEELREKNGHLCPHARIEFCPLYVQSHVPTGLGCVDDMMRPCMVIRKELTYADAIAKCDARMVAILKFNEDNFERTSQRKRNMRALGIQ